MNTFSLLAVIGEVNSAVNNRLEIDGLGGSAQIQMDSVSEGEAYPVLVIRNLPNLRPRISVPRENRTFKAGS